MPRSMIVPLLSVCSSLLLFQIDSLAASLPNVIVILTDDQGHGDLGFHGNPHIKTPNLDGLARQSARFSHFYVSPVCSPTRASLLTGRYNYRTGVTDTFLGRSIMCSDELTLAEMLREHGYRTGIFGKWHLGDNYPMRAIDQGFEEALVHKGGGIGQPSDPPGGESYFDPVLQHNGKQVKTKGYCSDVFTSAALRFIERNREKPLFVWLAFNAPHAPLQLPEKYHARYRGKDFGEAGSSSPTNNDITARIYGMVSNIDDNLGRLLALLDELHLATNTIVVFLTDNGPQQRRYNSGLRGLKGSVYEGGIRVPFFLRWPGKLKPQVLDDIAAHIDLAPTILNACGLSAPHGVQFDGRSLWPLLNGNSDSMPQRTLFFQWHRGDVPEWRRAFAVRNSRYKLVQSRGVQRPAEPVFELFDVSSDPAEQHNLGGAQPEIRDALLHQYDTWFKDVTAPRPGAPPRIFVGDPHENPTILTRQDWRGTKAGWTEDSIGHWEIDVKRAGKYSVMVQYAKLKSPATLRLTIGGLNLTNTANDTSHRFKDLPLESGPSDLHCVLEESGRLRGVNFVEVRRR